MTSASDSTALTSSGAKSDFTALSTSNTPTTWPLSSLTGTTTSLRLAELHATCPGNAWTCPAPPTFRWFPKPPHKHLFLGANECMPRALERDPRPNCLEANRRDKSQPNANQMPARLPPMHWPNWPILTIPPSTMQTTWAQEPQGETLVARSCRWEGFPPWLKNTFPEPSNAASPRNQAMASQTPPNT